MSELEQESQEKYSEQENVIVMFIRRRVQKLSEPAFQKQVMWSTGSIAIALLVGAVVMTMSGYNTGLAFIVLIRGAIVQFDRVLFNATPLIFTGLSVALAFKCGLFNIGPEGQLYIGSLAAAVAGYMVALPIFIHPIFCLALAGLAGFIWGFIPGLLKAYRGAHEVVTTMMIAYATILLTQWLVKDGGPFWDGSDINETPLILPTAWINIPGSDFLNFGFFVGLLAVFAVDFLINRTVIGYEMRAVGLNRDAAEYAGINAKKNMALSLGFAGLLAGLGGGEEILGYHHRFIDGWSSGYGWDGITVAVLGNNNPWGVFAGAIFFGALRTGGNAMQRIAGVPAEMVVLIQGLIVMLVAAPRIVDWFLKRGQSEAKVFRANPMDGLTNLLPTGFSFVSSMFAFTMIIPLASYSALGSLTLVLVGLLSIISFTQFLSREQAGARTLFVTAVGWFVVACLALMTTASATATTSVLMGLISVVLLAMHRFIPSRMESPEMKDETETEVGTQ